MSVPDTDITVGMPAYNEEANIERVVSEVISLLSGQPYTWEIVVVDNKSEDNTVKCVEKLIRSDARVRLIRHCSNEFYSGSCSTILREALGHYIMILDSDGQFTAADLPGFMKAIDEGFDLVIGWRKTRRDPLPRLWASMLFNALGKLWLSYPYHDLNCGIRMFNRKFANAAFIEHRINMANPELYVRALNAGCKVGEIECRHYERQGGSTSHKFGKSLRLLVEVNRYMRALRKQMDRP